jgi:flagellar biosynthetic protein FliP
MRRRLARSLLAIALLAFSSGALLAQDAGEPALPGFPAPSVEALPSAPAVPPGTFMLNVSGLDTRSSMATALKIIAIMTVLSLAPAILIMMTSFTRIIVVLGFIKHALSLGEVPPKQVLAGLALFLTMFVMAPTWDRINSDALQPYMSEEIDEAQAFRVAEGHVRTFLLNNTRETDLAMMYGLSRLPAPETLDDVPTYAVIPAFLLSELKTAFMIGFLILVPFLILDMVVAAILLSMGMIMMPPIIVSLPFKIILFVLVDGWDLVVGELIRSFN